MNIYQLFSKRILLIGSTNLLIAITSILTIPILTKSLLVSEYGYWVQIMAMISLIPTVITLGLPFAMVRFLACETDSSKIKDSFYSVLYVTFGITGIAAIIIFLIFYLFGYSLISNDVLLIGLFGLILILECLNSVCFSYFRAMQKISQYSVLTISQSLFLIGSLLFLLKFNSNIIFAVVALFVSRVSLFIINFGMIIHQIGVKYPSFKNIMPYVRFGAPLLPSQIASWIVSLSDRFVIALFLGIAFVGYYNPGYSLGAIITMIVAPMSFLLPATLADLYENAKYGEIKSHIRYSIKYFLLLSIPAAILLSINSKQIITLLSTDIIAQFGYLVTPIAAANGILFGLYAIISQILVMKKETKVFAYIWIASAFINVSLNFIFISRIGLIGAALSAFVANLLVLVLTIRYSITSHFISIDWTSIYKILIASIIMIIPSLILISGNIIVQVIIGLISLGIYFICLLILRIFSTGELKLITGLISYKG